VDGGELCSESWHNKRLSENTLLVAIEKASKAADASAGFLFCSRKRRTNDAKMAMKNAFLFSINADMPDLPVSSRRRMAAAPIVRPWAPVMIDGVSWERVVKG
jgi:uncharacterized protein YdaU (DUF1376 family)